MPAMEKPAAKSFYAQIKLDEDTPVDQLQAIAILTDPNSIYVGKKDENLSRAKNLLGIDKLSADDAWTATAASDSQFALDLHGMAAIDKIYKLTGGDKLEKKLKQTLENLPKEAHEKEKNKAEYKPYAFTSEQYRVIQVYKRFLEGMRKITPGLNARFIEATLPKAVLEPLSHFALLKVMTKAEIVSAQKQLSEIEETMQSRTESYFLRENLDAQVKAGILKPEEAIKALWLKQIYDNQLSMIENQRLNHTSTQVHFKNTSLAATAFHTTAAISNVLILVANFVPVINLFAHPLKLGLEIVNSSLLIAAYNLDLKMKAGPNPYTDHERKEISERRAAAKVHLQAIKIAKLKEVTIGLLGSVALVGALFAGPLAPFLAPMGAAGLLLSNFYAQQAIQAEIDLLKRVGIKRDKAGNPVMEPVIDKEGKAVYENVMTLKDGKEISEKRIKQQAVRLMQDYDLRLSALKMRLSGKKWSTYAAGVALGGALGTAAMAGAVLLGAASVAFPPLLIAIAAVTACVAIFCAVKSVKKTYDEKQLTTAADFQINRDGMKAMDKTLHTLSHQLNIHRKHDMPGKESGEVKALKEGKALKETKELKEKLESPRADMSTSLLTLMDTLQHQKEALGEVISNKASSEIPPENQNAAVQKDMLDEYELSKHVQRPSGCLREGEKSTAVATASAVESKLRFEQSKEDEGIKNKRIP